MRFLHTSDWHVGKVLKGHSRLDEQRAVLREIVQVARDHRVDAVLVAATCTSRPPRRQRPSSWSSRCCSHSGAPEPRSSRSPQPRPRRHLRRLPAAHGEHRDHLGGGARVAADGGVVRFTARSTGEPVVVALLPFLSQRHAVRAAHLVTKTPGRPRPAMASWCGTCSPRSRPASATTRSTW
ncbi:exonuclease SbcCD subunit D [Streptosporangium lutulentum]